MSKGSSESRYTKLARIFVGLFFLVGGSINLIGPESILQEYRIWGFPSWFHFVTGSLELATACLTVARGTRLYAVVLGCAVMIGAAMTLALHHALGHVLLPVFVLALLVFSCRTSFKKTGRQ